MAGVTGSGSRVGIALVALHFAANLAHGGVHQGPPVPLSTVQTGFVVVVVTIGPLASLWLLRTDRPTFGWATLAAVLLASFVFGAAFHYVLATPDHVANVPAGTWKLPFEATAALVAVVDGGGAIAAAWYAVTSAGEGRPADEPTA